MPRRLSLAHALGTGQPHFPIQVHGENPPTLPVARKGKGGRLLRRPQQAHPAATMADFRTAVLSQDSEISRLLGECGLSMGRKDYEDPHVLSTPGWCKTSRIHS